MSNCYYDRTGVLVFNGVPVPSPVVRALFGAFNLNVSSIGDVSSDKTTNELDIGEFAEDGDVSWSAISESISEHAAELGIEWPEDATAWDIQVWLSLLAAKHNVVDGRTQQLLASGQFDGDADPCTLLDLALEFNDGHNLLAVKYEAAWHGDGKALYGFGGAGTFHSPRVSLTISTSDVRKAGQELDAAIWANDPGAAARALGDVVDKLLAGITDEAVRTTVWKQIAAARC